MGNLDVGKQYLYALGIAEETVLSTGPRPCCPKANSSFHEACRSYLILGKSKVTEALRVVTGSLFLTGWVQRQGEEE